MFRYRIIHFLNDQSCAREGQMLDPRLLRAFIAIVEAGGFTKAAERLHMTQSTLSQQLARLEDAVGQSLLDRDTRPIRPSSAGERLLGYARRIVALQQEAKAALGNPAGTTPIHIGLPEDVFGRPMAQLFGGFSKRHPEIRLDVSAGLSRTWLAATVAASLTLPSSKNPHQAMIAGQASLRRWAGSRAPTLRRHGPTLSRL